MKSEKTMAIILGITIVGIVIGVSGGLSLIEDKPNFQSSDPDTKLEMLNIDKSKFRKAPELTGISGYINVTPEELKAKIKNMVVLYDIWTYSCINCIRTLPYITAWDEKYSDQGLLIIGIHSPEFEFEKDIDNVKMAVEKHAIQYPVILDNDKEIWKSFENRYWPRKYITDHEGYIRYDHIGEGAYQETEKIIQELLAERAQSLGTDMSHTQTLVNIESFKHSNFRTPELYFGYKFAMGRNQIGNTEGFSPNNDVTYKIPENNLRQHYFYLDGVWKNLEGGMKLISETGKIALQYSGKEVNIVTANEADLQIFVDGKIIEPSIAGKDIGTRGRVHVHDDGLYNIVNSENSEQHLLEIIVNDPGFEIYTFTFG